MIIYKKPVIAYKEYQMAAEEVVRSQVVGIAIGDYNDSQMVVELYRHSAIKGRVEYFDSLQVPSIKKLVELSTSNGRTGKYVELCTLKKRTKEQLIRILADKMREIDYVYIEN